MLELLADDIKKTCANTTIVDQDLTYVRTRQFLRIGGGRQKGNEIEGTAKLRMLSNLELKK